MPTYDYKCLNCGNKFEYFQKMTDEPLTECPECGGRVKRLIGIGVGLIFKGHGFYETDYKKKESSYKSGKDSKSSPNISTSKKASAKDKKQEFKKPA